LKQGNIFLGWFVSLHTPKSYNMKNTIIVASLTLSVFCCLYCVRLLDAAEESAVVTTGNLPLVPTTFSNVEVDQKLVTTPSITGMNLKTRRSERIINGSENETIKCKAGTKLFFPAESFVTAGGFPVKGKVRVIVEECYDLDEILAAKLSTTSGNKQLETAGMIRVQAFVGRSEVYLREGGRYNIHFPVGGDRKEDFRLFYGKRDVSGTMDWVLEENDTPINEAALPVSSVMNECFIQISASELRIGNRIQKMDYFNWPLVNGQNLNQWFISGFNPDPAMLNDFCANRMNSQITFHVNEQGQFQDYYISHSSLTEYDRLIASALSTMPALDMKKFMPQYTEDHACVLSFGRQQESGNKAFLERFVKRYDYEDPDQKMAGVRTEDLSYYVFSSTELGWINCDRFMESQGPLVDVVVETSGGESVGVSMVFDRERSILAGKKVGDTFVFTGVPANKMARLIALANPGGTPQMQVSTINTSCERHQMRITQSITLADLDRALCWN
jgi:hypothetical protein